MEAKATPPKTVDEMMSERERKAMDLLKEIENLIHDMPAPESDGLNWGHVGSLGHAVLTLTDVRNFLKS